MKYKVTKRYVDRYTLEMHREGEVVSLTADRAKELEGYVEKTEKATKKTK